MRGRVLLLMIIAVSFVASMPAGSIHAQVSELRNTLSRERISESKENKDKAVGVDFGARPVNGGEIVSKFGPRKLFGHKFHYGIDIAVPNGTPAYAIWDGVVIKTGYHAGGGRYLDIKYNNGYTSRYYHLQKVLVKKGEKVRKGQLVARTNNTGTWTTGPHLHFEFTDQTGRKVDPESIPGFEL